MKKRNLLVVTFLLLSVLLVSGICNGAAITPKWVAYDYTTKVEPPTGFAEGSSSSSMSSFCKIDNGVLIMDTMSAPTAGPTYRLPVSTTKVGFKFTVVVRAKANSNIGMDFDFRSGLRERIKLLNSVIELNTSGNKADIKATDWHTYFISYEFIDDAGITKLVTKVYVDGGVAPLIEGKSTTADSASYFRFGDGSGSDGYAGSIDWIMWTFDGAYSPDQVNLPDGFSLK